MEMLNLALVLAICVFVSVVVELGICVSANVVFEVHNKFHMENSSLSAYVDHDSHRRRILSGVDLHIGGGSNPSYVALYYTKIHIGSPPKEYHVQIDTASDILWVNCAGCVECPKTSDLGMPLSLYDPRESSTSRNVACEEEFCTTTLAPFNSRCFFGMRCPYVVKYSDGSSTTGYFVSDIVQLNKISGNLKTTNMTGNIMFGCGARQTGTLGGTKQAIDGVLGFGQSNSSMISQLASSKKVKKMFSHCLTRSKGGIFAIGEVVHPKVNSTPMLPNMAHFSIELKAIQVDNDFVTLPAYMFNTPEKRGAIIDSGTTLAYFPRQVYSQLMEKVMAAQPNVEVHIVDGKFKCYAGEGNVDNAFPMVTFHFANDLKLRVHPHQYIFRTRHNLWCIGFLSNGPQPRGSNTILLGDVVMTNKLVTYNMEDQTIGWMDYDCFSSIKLKDEESGKVYKVGAHNIKWAGPRGGSGRAKVSGFALLVLFIATKIIMYQ